MRGSADKPGSGLAGLLPYAVLAAAVGAWWWLSSLHLWPDWLFPAPPAVLKTLVQRVQSGQLLDDTIASLFRVSTGFILAVISAVPLGLWLGHQRLARVALLPWLNFLRNLSPLAWITFAILWFPRWGDASIIFLIFLSAFPPVALSVAAAVANIPSVYFQVGRD